MSGPEIIETQTAMLLAYTGAAVGLVALSVGLYIGLKWTSHLSYMAGGVGWEWGGNGGYRTSDGTTGDQYGLIEESIPSRERDKWEGIADSWHDDFERDERRQREMERGNR